MKKLFYKTENSRARISTLSVLTASIVLATIVFFGLCMEKVDNPPYISPPKEMKKGDIFQCNPFAPVELTIEDVNDDDTSCLAAIKVTTDNRVYRGWVKKGEAVPFVPDFQDSMKLYIEGIEKGKVFVVLQYGKVGYKYKFRGPWHYLEL